MPPPIRVLLVDDHAVVRTGLRLLLERDPRFQVVGEAGTAAAALEAVDTLQPDVVVLELSLPDQHGVPLIAAVRARVPPPQVLVLSHADTAEVVHQAIAAGATGYLLKGATVEAFRSAIMRVAAGDAVFSPTLSRRLVEQPRRPPPHEALSPREREVFGLLVTGLSNQEIAQRLRVTLRTAGNHVNAIYRKLDLRHRTDAVRYAAEHGLLPNDPAAR